MVLAPGAVLGSLLLLLAFVRGGAMPIGWALALAGAVYVGAIVHRGHRIDALAPVVALLLLLCGELSAWSLDERWTVTSDERLGWRRVVGLGALALIGLAAAALVVALTAVPASHGLAWTATGSAAAVSAVGMGVWLVRR